MPPVFIHVVRAEGLAVLDRNGLSDPFCVVSISGHTSKKQTLVVERDLNPIWDERFIFHGNFTGKEILSVEIFDKDFLVNEDAGDVSIPLSSFANRPVSKWFPVQRKQGRIFLRLGFLESHSVPSFEETTANDSFLPERPSEQTSGDAFADDVAAGFGCLRQGTLAALAVSGSKTPPGKPKRSYFVVMQGIPRLYQFKKKSEKAVTEFIQGKGPPKSDINLRGLFVSRQYVSHEKGAPSRTLAIAICNKRTKEELHVLWSPLGDDDTAEWMETLQFLTSRIEFMQDDPSMGTGIASGEEDPESDSDGMLYQQLSSSSLNSGVPVSVDHVLQGPLMLRQQSSFKYALLRQDELLLFVDKSGALDYVVHKAQSTRPRRSIAFLHVVGVSTRGSCEIQLSVSSEEAKVQQASEKVQRMLYDQNDAKQIRARQNYSLLAPSTTLRDTWFAEINRCHQIGLASSQMWSALRLKQDARVVQLVAAGARADESNRDARSGLLPVQYAASRGVGVLAVSALLDVYPTAVRDFLANGDTLAHACARANPIDVASLGAVLDRYPQAAWMSTSQRDGENNVLHLTAGQRNWDACLEVLKHGDTVARQTNVEEELPLHVILAGLDCMAPCSGEGQMLGVVEELLAANPRSVLAPDKDGEYPLHVAIASGSCALVNLILRTNKDAMRQKTTAGDYPIHTACRRLAECDANSMSDDGEAKGEAFRVASQVYQLDIRALDERNTEGMTARELLTKEQAQRLVNSAITVTPVEIHELRSLRSEAFENQEKKQKTGSWFSSLFALCCGPRPNKRGSSLNNADLRLYETAAKRGGDEGQLPHHQVVSRDSGAEKMVRELEHEAASATPAMPAVAHKMPSTLASGAHTTTHTPTGTNSNVGQFLVGGRLPNECMIRVYSEDIQLQETKELELQVRELNQAAKEILEEMVAIRSLSEDQLELQAELNDVVENTNKILDSATVLVEAGLSSTKEAKAFSSNWFKLFATKDSKVKKVLFDRMQQ